ncbi:hypothetical protein ACFSUJ_35280 [Streptomyces lusitanus]|uniref:hypothetical protein n=1 Tax=Streptomyces lusitanus TaxID=68232 RepID=UPI003643D64C
MARPAARARRGRARAGRRPGGLRGGAAVRSARRAAPGGHRHARRRKPERADGQGFYVSDRTAAARRLPELRAQGRTAEAEAVARLADAPSAHWLVGGTTGRPWRS